MATASHFDSTEEQSNQVSVGDGRGLRRRATETGNGDEQWQWQGQLAAETGGSEV